jgi:hypothetical protein
LSKQASRSQGVRMDGVKQRTDLKCFTRELDLVTLDVLDQKDLEFGQVVQG